MADVKLQDHDRAALVSMLDSQVKTLNSAKGRARNPQFAELYDKEISECHRLKEVVKKL